MNVIFRSSMIWSESTLPLPLPPVGKTVRPSMLGNQP